MRLAVSTMLALAVVLFAGSASAQLIGVNIDTTTVTPDGPPYTLDSLSAGGFSTTTANLDVGAIRGLDNSGNYLGSWQPPFSSPSPASNLDLNDLMAKNDPAATDPTADANPIDVLFGGTVGVTTPWKDRNGANPDFFAYEGVPVDQQVIGGGDLVDVAAILPGGVIGQSVFLPYTGEWGDTGLLKQGNPNNGQAIVGVAFAVTELKNASGTNLTNTSELEGIRIYSSGIDLTTVVADVAAPALPLELNVNTDNGNVEIRNPNPAGSYTLGFNFYRLDSNSFALDNDGWSSLDAQEGPDDPGDGWEEGGGSFNGPVAPGDYNENGIVDAADFTVWRDGLGTEFNDNDYDVWVDNFGRIGGTTPTSTSQLLELNLDGLTEIAPGESVSLGAAFKTDGVNDIQFTYGVEAGLMVGGVVNSVTGVAVPEPSSALLGGLGLLLLAMWRRTEKRPLRHWFPNRQPSG